MLSSCRHSRPAMRVATPMSIYDMNCGSTSPSCLLGDTIRISSQHSPHLLHGIPNDAQKERRRPGKLASSV